MGQIGYALTSAVTAEALALGGNGWRSGLSCQPSAVGLATGTIDRFSWSGVAMGAIGSAAGVAAGGMVGRAVTLSNVVARSTLGSALTQGAALATGLQQKFNWQGVAAAAVGGAAGYGMQAGLSDLGVKFGSTTFANQVGYGTAAGLANGVVQAAVFQQRPNWSAIAVNSFGSALGEAVVGEIQRRDEILSTPIASGGDNALDRANLLVGQPADLPQLRLSEAAFAPTFNAAPSEDQLAAIRELRDSLNKSTQLGDPVLVAQLQPRRQPSVIDVAKSVVDSPELYFSGADFNGLKGVFTAGRQALASAWEGLKPFDPLTIATEQLQDLVRAKGDLATFAGVQQQKAVLWASGLESLKDGLLTYPSRFGEAVQSGNEFETARLTTEAALTVASLGGLRIGSVGRVANSAGVADGLRLSGTGPTRLIARDPVELAAQRRLNALDGDVGKFRPGEAGVAAEMENYLGGTLRRAPAGTSADFIVETGPFAGARMDLKLTPDTFAQAGKLNSYFDKTFPKFSESFAAKLAKPDGVDLMPFDTRFLTPSNSQKLFDFVDTLPLSSQQKIIYLGH